jgi:uncharacterized protein (TIGR02391 family)
MSTRGLQPANLSAAQITDAIRLLEARIGELEQLSGQIIWNWRDPKVQAVEHKVEATLARIFNRDTVEYQRLRTAAELDARQTSTRILPSGLEVSSAVQENSKRAIALLHSEIALLKEQMGENGAPTSRAIRAYSSLDLHPEIARAASGLYGDGHYANAIEDAVKALNAFVRMRSGVELDGAALMQKVFSPNSPVLRFNDLADQNDKDEQLGFMMMLSGAVAGLRNPRAHKIIKDDPERALEFIAFISLLAKLVDEAVKV